MRSLFLGLAFLVPSVGLAQHEAHGDALGHVVFPNSGNPAAQAPFLRGIALLHSFEYERAAQAFREAEGADRSFALAYWTEALTYSHLLWREEDLEAARGALKRLGPSEAVRLSLAGTARERAFGEAVEAFYRDGTQPERVRRYADGMRRLAWAYPDDPEALAFAAHAILLAADGAGGAEHLALTREAIGLAERVARENPEHPGAVHYLIHLYDAPGMAAQGLAFARAYDRIAPQSEHALHMPSHIYLQLGLWEDVVHSNERAWAASRAEGRTDWHAFSWLQYAYLQLGRVEDARGLIDTARALVDPATPYVDERFILPRLEFQLAAETGRWERPIPEPLGLAGAAASDREAGFRLFARYWRAVGAAERGDSMLPSLAAPFLAIADSAERGIGSSRSPVQVANALVLRALVAKARGNEGEHIASLRSGAELERRFGQFVGPPERLFALELLGEELERQQQWSEAADAYQAVLRLCPNRTRSVRGLERAQRAGEFF